MGAGHLRLFDAVQKFFTFSNLFLPFSAKVNNKQSFFINQEVS